MEFRVNEESSGIFVEEEQEMKDADVLATISNELTIVKSGSIVNLSITCRDP